MAAQPTLDPDYRKVAEAHYAHLLTQLDHWRRYQVEIAKWLLASLVLVHGGAIVALIQTPDGRRVLGIVAAFFVLGIILATASGLLVWINTGLLIGAFEAMIDPKMLVSVDHYPKPQNGRWINVTYYAAIIAGIASLSLFASGAISAASDLSSLATPPPP